MKEETILWEEKNLIEQKKNLPNNQTIVPKDITNDIKKNAIENPCKDIGNKNWKRNCPSCGKSVFHKTKRHRNRAVIKNSNCIKCNNLNKIGKSIHSNDFIEKQRNRHKGKHLSFEIRNKISLSNIGHTLSEESKQKILINP